MISFTVSLILLTIGYVVYGAIADRVFGIDASRPTPAMVNADGVDYMPMPAWRVFLIQFLNIAGTGPIFGAILGILYGPAAYIWIVLGCIFGGAVHDYFCGMLSVRNGGVSLPEIVGNELGESIRVIMRVFSVVLLLLVGTVFVQTPALILANITTGWGVIGSVVLWTIIIFGYYILATLLPIDKLIGRFYPVFGIALLIMAVGVCYGIYTREGIVPEITDALANHHPSGNIPLFPGLCVTIACGAVSGFHGTQSPLMARCIENERQGRMIFYGAMIAEGLVALIWAAAAIKFADSLDVAGATPYEKLIEAMRSPETGQVNPAFIVNKVCSSWLGTIGSILAVLGVVAAPVTSGDTAFRSARLIAADFMRYKQNKIYKRVMLSLPMFVISAALMFVDFQVIWRYFAWTNQTLAVFTLWTATCWLERQGKNYYIALIPALWMTLVCSTYIFIAPEGFSLNHTLSYCIGGVITIGIGALFFYQRRKTLSPTL